jgi:hypothetical protein
MKMSISRLFVSAGIVLASMIGAGDLEAQVATANARPFVGEWNVAIQGEMASNFQLSIKDDGGQLEVVVTSADGTVRPVAEVTKVENDLVLNYSTGVQGAGELPITIRFTGEGDALTGDLDLADGMFSAPVRATKQEG